MTEQLSTTPSADAETVPATMTAIVQRGYGGPEVLHREEIEVPAPDAGQVLLRVAAAGLDRGVWHLMAGLPYLVRPMFGMSTPRQPIPGLDVAGTVVALGPGAEGFSVGDRVFGIAAGSFAEYAVATTTSITHLPDGVSSEDAAALPVSGLTAFEAVHTHGGVQPGQRVLVTGASGGVGGYAVQLAAAAGADVTGVASGVKADFVRSLGAGRSIDYGTTVVTDLPDRYDLIVDVNGRLPLGRLVRILTPAGALVIVGGENGGRLTGGIERQFGARLRSAFTRRRLGFFISSETRADLPELARLVETGALRSTATTMRPLAEVRQAIADLTDGRVRGKAVIRVAA